MINYFSISSKLLTSEAKTMGFQVKVLNKNKNFFSIKWNNKLIYFKTTDFGGNSSLAAKICNDKELSHNYLKENNYRVADTITINVNENLNSFKNNIKFPCVIKPVSEWHWDDVYMNINSLKECIEIIEVLRTKYKSVQIQQQILGDEIRVLIVKWKLIAAIKRLPAFIIGDGKKTIYELIKCKNNWILRGEDYNKPLCNIKIDTHVIRTLYKKNISLDNVIKPNERVFLRSNSNLGTGGTPVDVTDTLSKKTIKILIELCDKLGLWIAGIDIVTKDHTLSLEKSGIILEMNATPWLWWDKSVLWINSAEKILKILFAK